MSIARNTKLSLELNGIAEKVLQLPKRDHGSQTSRERRQKVSAGFLG